MVCEFTLQQSCYFKKKKKSNRICPHSACGFKIKKGIRNDSKIWGLSKWENGGKMREIRGRIGL